MIQQVTGILLTLVGKQFYCVTLRKLPGVTHDMSVHSSQASQVAT